MKTNRIVLIHAALGGCAAFVLRLIQNRVGFESGTGLPIAGSPAALALLALLAAFCAGAAALSFRFPKNGVTFPFAPSGQIPRVLCTAGAFLLALSGGLKLQARLFTVSGNADRIFGLLCGVLSVCAAGGVLVSIQNRRDNPENALLFPPIAIVVQLIADYRVDSINPILVRYAPEMAALALLALGFYQITSFAFGGGNLRRLAFYTGSAVPLSLCAAADGGLSSAAMYVGAALALMGYFQTASQSPLRPETQRLQT